jgi:alpha-beta hydrolase superfamily lysophospholipase
VNPLRRATGRIRFRSASGEEVRLAVDFTLPRRPARVVGLFMPGYGSRRGGQKARAFAEAFGESGAAFLSFEPRGHGDSSGRLEELTLERHFEDLEAAVAFARTVAPSVVGLGSSLGGLAMATFAAIHPRAFRFLVLIAPGFGLFERWTRLPPSRRPPAVTAEVIRSARPTRTSSIAPRLRTPCLIWHGMRDDAVPWKESAAFAERAGAFVELRLLSRGDHRLTRWKERLARESAARVLEVVPSG